MNFCLSLSVANLDLAALEMLDVLKSTRRHLPPGARPVKKVDETFKHCELLFKS